MAKSAEKYCSTLFTQALHVEKEGEGTARWQSPLKSIVQHCSHRHSCVQSGCKTIKPAAQLLGKSRFGGSIMNHHGNKKEIGQLLQKLVAGTLEWPTPVSHLAA